MEIKRERLDIEIVNRGILSSRNEAREAIMSEKVYVDGKVITKPGRKVSEENKIEFKGERNPFVSRGGYKLLKAIEDYNLNLENCVCMDIGASTGGFTDCMLQHGASKVYAIDVGTDQLHEKLRGDKRVVSLENTNIRDLDEEFIIEDIEVISIDVSFISLTKVLPKAFSLLGEDGVIVALIKPQFECGSSNLNKKGVVKNKEVHKDVLNKIVDFVYDNNKGIRELTSSPITGPNGNIEYLVIIDNNSNDKSVKEQISNEVENAYKKYK